MLPFISIFGRAIPMYSLCIMVGVILGIWAATLRAGTFAQKKEDVLFASFYGVLGAIVGGKILYLLTIAPWLSRNFESIISNIEQLKALMSGGFVFYGGLFGAVLGIFIYAKQYRLTFIDFIEIMTPAIPLIHAFGRLGCFCAGCCYGRPYPPPLGLLFKASQAAPGDITLFPVQLVEAILNLALFLFLYRQFKNKHTRGEAAALYLGCYGVIRFVLEFFRYDQDRGFILGISTSQWISIGTILLAIVILFKLKKDKQRQTKERDDFYNPF